MLMTAATSVFGSPRSDDCSSPICSGAIIAQAAGELCDQITHAVLQVVKRGRGKRVCCQFEAPCCWCTSCRWLC